MRLKNYIGYTFIKYLCFYFSYLQTKIFSVQLLCKFEQQNNSLSKSLTYRYHIEAKLNQKSCATLAPHK